MARRKPAPDPVEEPVERSPLAGGCVLVVLGGGAFAGLWAASPEAAVLAVWVVGTVAVWWSTRRRKGTYQPLPSPTVAPSPEEVFAVETGRAARVVKEPSGMTIVYPEIEYVAEHDLP
jgi:hypothetical protein